MPDQNEKPSAPLTGNEDLVTNAPGTRPAGEKLPEHEIAARSAQSLANAVAELERDRGISIWLYGLALILLMFIAALIFLTAVASSPTPR